jgi:hypothetical protein
MRLNKLLLAVLAVSLLVPFAWSQTRFNEALLDGFNYRHTGPFRAGQWVADVAVPDQPAKSHLYTIYVASRNGGIWKTTNAGTTWEPIFDKENVLSMGSISIAPSNENVVWVGTGDASMTRMTYPGNGVYKSTDAGKTWTNMGLKDTQHIGRIVVDPKNPEIVYVAAMGTNSLPMPSAACSRPPTAARPGRRSCSPATAPARSISS